MLISGSSGTGKTTFCEKLLQSNISEKFNQIYYIYPDEFEKPPGIIKYCSTKYINANLVDWDRLFPEITIEYIPGVPGASFFHTVREDSLIILDDLWTECCKSSDIVKAFKVFSRKMRFSLITISQSYFGGSDGGREIRNNVDVVVLFENHGDADLNTRIMRKLGYINAYRQAVSTLKSIPHSYLVVNCSAKISHAYLRVASNLFSESHQYIEFYV